MSVQSAKVELVYFDIHARGELSRLCFAAAGKLAELHDTRVPLFMESAANSQLWTDVWSKRAPEGYLPYLNVHDDEGTFQVTGDGEVEMFVARHVGGLLGSTEEDAKICMKIATNVVGLCGPDLTQAGLRNDGKRVCASLGPNVYIGQILAHTETYVKRIKKEQQSSRYILGDSLSLADLAIFNSVDEILHGPRSVRVLPGVRSVMDRQFPILMQTYQVVKEDMAAYLRERLGKFTSKEGVEDVQRHQL